MLGTILEDLAYHFCLLLHSSYGQHEKAFKQIQGLHARPSASKVKEKAGKEKSMNDLYRGSE